MDPRVRSWLDRAQELTEAGAYADAADHERMAADRVAVLGDRAPERAALLDQASRRRLAEGSAAAAKNSLRELVDVAEEAGETRLGFLARHRLGLVAQLEGDHGAALGALDDALAYAHGRFGPVFTPAAATHLARARSLAALQRRDEARGELEAAEAVARRGSDTRTAEAARRALGGLRRGHAAAPAASPDPPTSTPPAERRFDPDAVDAALAELDALVGLAAVKRQVRSLVNFMRVQQARQQAGHRTVTIAQHLCFVGSPGTGKTTVARLYGRLLHALGRLESDRLVETSRGDLVAGFIGQTATAVNRIVDASIGGVLFIDEAYALTAGDSPQDFGREAVAELIKRMEDDRDRLAVIFAGYDAPMRRFLGSNPGLASRVSEVVIFADYSAQELAEVFRRFAARDDYALSPAGEERLTAVLSEMTAARGGDFGNARTVRNLFEDAIVAQADRLVEAGAAMGPALRGLEPADLDAALESYRAGVR